MKIKEFDLSLKIMDVNSQRKCIHLRLLGKYSPHTQNNQNHRKPVPRYTMVLRAATSIVVSGTSAYLILSSKPLPTKFQYDIISLTKKTSNTDCAAFNFFAYIAQSVGTHYSGCQLFRSVYPMQPLGQARARR